MDTATSRKRLIRFGLFEADLEQHVLLKNGRRVRIQDQPFQILALLLEHPGKTLTREEIRRRIWTSGTYVAFDDGLNTAIKKLRMALGDAADNPLYIETVPRHGYRFVAPTSRDLDESPESAGLPNHQEHEQTVVSLPGSKLFRPDPASPWLFRWIAGGILLALLAGSITLVASDSEFQARLKAFGLH